VIGHKRIRIVSNNIQEGPLTYNLKGSNSKSQGWTDIRILDLPPTAVLHAELVIGKGKRATDILKDQTQKYGGEWVIVNAAFFNPKTGTLLGKTYQKGKVIFPDVKGKTEKRSHLLRRAEKFEFTREVKSTEVNFGICYAPFLVQNYIVMTIPIASERILPDVLATQPRTIMGLRSDGTFGIIIVDGRGTYDRGLNAQEAAYLASYLGYQFAGNFDGGGSTILASNSRVLLDRLDIDKINRDRNYHVADMSLKYAQRIIHHGLAIKIDQTILFSKET